MSGVEGGLVPHEEITFSLSPPSVRQEKNCCQTLILPFIEV